MVKLSPTVSNIDGVTERGWFWRATWWWVLTLPLGLTTWAAFRYAGSRTKRSDLRKASRAYAAALLAVILLVLIGNGKGTLGNVAAFILIVTWIVGMVHTALVGRNVNRQLSVINISALRRAQQELDRRDYGRQLLATNPVLARQLGVGRPEVAGSDSFGLVDVNHAGRPGLLMLPGLSDEHVRRVLDYRDKGGSFVSVGDLALYLDLPQTTIGPLEDTAVFDMGTTQR
jgi:DNA uptake protein ComE-like DNA-binding protein